MHNEVCFFLLFLYLVLRPNRKGNCHKAQALNTKPSKTENANGCKPRYDLQSGVRATENVARQRLPNVFEHRHNPNHLGRRFDDSEKISLCSRQSSGSLRARPVLLEVRSLTDAPSTGRAPSRPASPITICVSLNSSWVALIAVACDNARLAPEVPDKTPTLLGIIHGQARASHLPRQPLQSPRTSRLGDPRQGVHSTSSRDARDNARDGGHREGHR